VGLHPLAENFASVADAYESGRPDYPPAVSGAIGAELDLGPGARVLDLAAGTGKLTRRLLAGGFDVVAVEPQESLRAKLAEAVGADRVHEGVAEAIPLPEDSVQAVTVADAFHWFDQGPALAEMGRVLAPGGGIALVSMAPDWSGASWAEEVGELINSLRPEHPHFDGPAWPEVVSAAGGWVEPWSLRLTRSVEAEPDRIADYVASMSFIAALPDTEREVNLERVRQLVAAGETPDRLGVHVSIIFSRLA
jgi:SAM-dependent methyltransferase